MYKFTGFSEKANLALNNAVNCAEDMGHTYVGSEHILAGLLKDPTSVAGIVLQSRRVTYNNFYDKIRGAIGIGVPTELTVEDITPRCRRIIESASGYAAPGGGGVTGTEHLLMAVLRDGKCLGNRLLTQMGVTPADLCSEITKNTLGQEPAAAHGVRARETASPRKGGIPTLVKYSRSLTDEARAGRIDPVAGRQKEIERVIRILCRRTKNNPCLIGEPGVGKTAVVEGLALKIASGEAPEQLKDADIRSLELTGMVAGAKYRGDFEERIRSAVNEAAAAGNVILFIDEIHNLIGAGSAEGAVDAANILKPMLARGGVKLIGATTVEEYRKNIEKDSALERRFQTVTVEEPTKEETLNILRELRPRYEAHHGVSITDGALEAAVALSVRYITDRFLPDKAIDLVDEAAAGVNLQRDRFPPEIREMENDCARLNREKAEAVNAQDFEKAVEIRDREKEANRLLAAQKAQWLENGGAARTVEADDIAVVVSEWTRVPVKNLTESEKARLLTMEEEIKKTIIGQDEAVRRVVAALQRGRSGVKDPLRPIGSFLFCGPTGVGKTALAKELARTFFGSADALIRLDMAEFAEKHAVSRLVGSPPGYVGFEEGGQLTEQIRRKPYSVILFDEIEKAHPEIFHSLLQILDEGVLTSAQGRAADCRNCILIMTSNTGDRIVGGASAGMGFSGGEKKDGETAMRDAVDNELKKLFRPEFLNRIDETVIFHTLSRESIRAIAANLLEEIRLRLAGMGIQAVFTDSAADWFAEHGYSAAYGARHLKRLIVARAEDPVAKAIIAGELQSGGTVTFAAENGELKLSFSKKTG